MSLTALHPAGLDALPRGVQRPRFDRAGLRPGIVHLGIGAFARAHLLVFNDDALDAGAGPGWGVAGVSLRHADTRDALAPQQGLYALALRDSDASGAPREVLRVIGGLCELFVAADDPAAVLRRIASPETRILSLTVTEKGYCHDPASGALRADHPDIEHDLAQPDAPRSAVGLIVRGLALRRSRDGAGLTLLCLDNLPANGRLLRGLVLEFAERLTEPRLAGWIDRNCSFPCSMVDRIVPRTVDADRERIAAGLGQLDAWPVVAEPFIDWVLEDRFAAGRPPWPGVRWAADAGEVAASERVKLRMVNGAHSAIAYFGVVAGWATVDAAIRQPALRRFIDTLLRDEVEPTLSAAALPRGFRQRLLQRFANPALAHRCRQIAMDGSQKIPQRLLDTVGDRLASGASIERLAWALAAWLHFLRGRDEAGAPYPIDDPLAVPLQALWREAETRPDPLERAARLTGFVPVFGRLAGEPRLIAALAPALQSLRERGVAASLAALPDTAGCRTHPIQSHPT